MEGAFFPLFLYRSVNSVLNSDLIRSFLKIDKFDRVKDDFEFELDIPSI